MIKTHKILITLLFKSKKEIEKKINFEKINYDNIIVVASNHLMIPALYMRLKKNGLLNLCDKEFTDYIKYIYNLNKSRNKDLLEELKELSMIYVKNKIDHVFLKGSAYLANEIFEDIGERMIGDIDVLVAKSDYNKSIKLSKEFGYTTNTTFIFDSKHYPRMTHPKKLFALEIHNKLLKENNKLLNPESFLNKKVKLESDIYIPNKNDKILHTIYNHQINDFGNLNATISYRALYDISAFELKFDNFVECKYLNNFFLISDYMGVTKTRLKLNIVEKVYLFRFKSKIKYRLFNLIDNIICKQINDTPVRIYNFYRIFISSKYRSYLFKKISEYCRN